MSSSARNARICHRSGGIPQLPPWAAQSMCAPQAIVCQAHEPGRSVCESVLYGRKEGTYQSNMHHVSSVTRAVPYLTCHHGENSPCAPPWAIACQAECRHSADVAVSFVLIVQGYPGEVLVLWAPCVIPQDDEAAVLNEAGFLALMHARHLQARHMPELPCAF